MTVGRFSLYSTSYIAALLLLSAARLSKTLRVVQVSFAMKLYHGTWVRGLLKVNFEEQTLGNVALAFYLVLFKCFSLAYSVSSDQHGVRESLAFQSSSLLTWLILLHYFRGKGASSLLETCKYEGLLTIKELLLYSDGGNLWYRFGNGAFYKRRSWHKMKLMFLKSLGSAHELK